MPKITKNLTDDIELKGDIKIGIGETGPIGPKGDIGPTGPKGDSISIWTGTIEEYDAIIEKRS